MRRAHSRRSHAAAQIALCVLATHLITACSDDPDGSAGAISGADSNVGLDVGSLAYVGSLPDAVVTTDSSVRGADGGGDVGAVDVGAVDVGAVDVGAVDVGAVDDGTVDDGAVDDGGTQADGDKTEVSGGIPTKNGWPTQPIVLGDGSVWQPTRTISDGKGGQIVLRNIPPMLKPVKTGFDPALHEPGVVWILFREGSGVTWQDGRFVSSTGADLGAVTAIEAQFASVLGPAERFFPGDKVTMDAARLAGEQKTGEALRDLTLYFIRATSDTADVGAIADAYNASPLVELAGPMPRVVSNAEDVGTSTTADKGDNTPDLTAFQGYIAGSTASPPSAGGHGMTLAWSLDGGRGKGATGAQMENGWNLQHEDLDPAHTTSLGAWTTKGGAAPLTNEQGPGTWHDMAVLGIVQARNNGFGVTGLASAAKVQVASHQPHASTIQTWISAMGAAPVGAVKGRMMAMVLHRLSVVLPAGSVVFASLGQAAPNARNCSGTTDWDHRHCAPKIECLPAPPYKIGAKGQPVMRCEGMDLAGNGCDPAKKGQDCLKKYGFGARCLPVPTAAGPTPPKWRCGGHPKARACTSGNECDPGALCLGWSPDGVASGKRCGGFAASWASAAAAPSWVGPATKVAGQVCAAHKDCAKVGKPICHNNVCMWSDKKWKGSGNLTAPLVMLPAIRDAAAALAAKDVAFVLAAGNHLQRLGLMNDGPLQAAGADKGRGLLGNDKYKSLYVCPFSGCGGSGKTWLVGASESAKAEAADFTSRGPIIKLNSWGRQVATLGYGNAASPHFETDPATNQPTHNYTAKFSGTSAAAPLVAGVALAVQGVVIGATGAPLTRPNLLAALTSGGVAIGKGLESIGTRPLISGALKWLESNGGAGGGAALPAGTSALKAAQLDVHWIAATRQQRPGAKEWVNVAFRVRNEGGQISPPLGLRVTVGNTGSTLVDPKAPAAKTPHTLLWSHFNPYAPKDACNGKDQKAIKGCKAMDSFYRRVFLPMIDGKAPKASTGGAVTRYFTGEVDAAWLDGLSDPEVCVMLDRQANPDAFSRLNPGGKAPAIHRCGPLRDEIGAFALTKKWKIRALAFDKQPEVPLCGGASFGNYGNENIYAMAITTGRRSLALLAFPKSGSIGLLDYNSCNELDLDEKNDVGTCGAVFSLNRLELTTPTPGLKKGCDPAELAKKKGRRPTAIAVSRDQRYAAVTLGELTPGCHPGKLMFIDLSDPARPKLLEQDDGKGGKIPVELAIGPNPVGVVFSPQGSKDARIVTVHDTNAQNCKKAALANIIKLADVLAKGDKAKVTTRAFLYPCSGGQCSPRSPKRVVVDPKGLAAFVTFGEGNIKGALGMIRLSDLKPKVFHRIVQGFNIKGWDQPNGLAAMMLPSGRVRLVFSAYTFLNMDKDFSGNTCPSGKGNCGGFHWHDVDVAKATGYHVNAGRMLPMTGARDLVLSKDGKQALIVGETKTVLYDIGGFSKPKAAGVFSFDGGYRIVRPPPADDYCPEERCNGKDDDCDGEIDETWPTKDEPCNEGLGACAASGKQVCSADGRHLECSGKAGQAVSELCNGVDDDCNGVVDDWWAARLGDSCAVGKGACRRVGVNICDPGGQDIACSVKPGKAVAETCNGFDDDCDGDTDEIGKCKKNDPCKGVTCGGAGSCKSAGTTAWCACNVGYTANGLTCAKSGTCSVKWPSPYAACPKVCTGGCTGHTCVIDCAGPKGCAGAILTCPADRPCRVLCRGPDSCQQATIQCGDGMYCDVRCLAGGACQDASITCGKGLCTTACATLAGQPKAAVCGAACGCWDGCK